MKYQGMIGSFPCQRSLEQILSRLNDEKITNIVMHRLQDFKEQCRMVVELLAPHNARFAKEVLVLCRQKAMDETESRKEDMPKDCFTHWQTCLVSEYRNALREIGN